MLEENARVVRIEVGQVWVETQRRSTCSSCAVEKGCGTATLAKVLGQRRTLVRVLTDLPLVVGDQVVIGIREQALVRGSLAVYAVPLLLLLAGAIIGELGAGQGLWVSAEAASLLLGVGGFVAGLLWLRFFSRQIHHNAYYQPVVIRRNADPVINRIAIP